MAHPWAGMSITVPLVETGMNRSLFGRHSHRSWGRRLREAEQMPLDDDELQQSAEFNGGGIADDSVTIPEPTGDAMGTDIVEHIASAVAKMVTDRQMDPAERKRLVTKLLALLDQSGEQAVAESLRRQLRLPRGTRRLSESRLPASPAELRRRMAQKQTRGLPRSPAELRERYGR